MEEVTLEVRNLVNFTEAAEMLKVSRPTIYEYIRKQRLHPITIGRNRYLLRNELERLKEDKDGCGSPG